VLRVLMETLLDAAESLVDNAEHIRQRSEDQRGRSTEVQESSSQLVGVVERLTHASHEVAAQAQSLLHLAQVLDSAGA
jgi:methyl-accepting chemotaxis protein